MCAQLYPTLCDLTDYSLPGFSVHGILQARLVGWLFPSPGDLPNPGIKLASPALAGKFFTSEPSGNPNNYCDRSLKSEVPCGSCLNWR